MHQESERKLRMERTKKVMGLSIRRTALLEQFERREKLGPTFRLAGEHQHPHPSLEADELLHLEPQLKAVKRKKEKQRKEF